MLTVTKVNRAPPAAYLPFVKKDHRKHSECNNGCLQISNLQRADRDLGAQQQWREQKCADSDDLDRTSAPHVNGHESFEQQFLVTLFTTLCLEMMASLGVTACKSDHSAVSCCELGDALINRNPIGAAQRGYRFPK